MPNFSHLVTPAEAELLITQELRAALYEAESQAWEVCRDWPNRYPEFSLRDGCFAHVMNEAVTTIVRRTLGGLVDRKLVGLDDDPGFLLVLVTTRPDVAVGKPLGLKFNKLDEDLQPSRNRSFQNESIFSQGWFPFSQPTPSPLRGKMTMATVGWCPDPEMKRPPDFAVACNVDTTLLWSIPLLAPPAEGTVPIPTPPPAEGGPPVRSATKDPAKKKRKAE